MIYLVLLYGVITLFDSGRALWNGDFTHALAVFGASILAFAAGAGFRGSLHLGNPKLPAVVIAAVLLGASIGLMHFFDLTVDFIDGTIWSVIGAGVAFLAAKKEDALPRGETSWDAPSEADARATLEIYREAVVRLGAIIEEKSGFALPESELPLPRAEMKKALKAMWLAIDDPHTKGAIQAGYGHIAYFRSDLDEATSLSLGVEDATAEDGDLDLEGIQKIQEKIGLMQTVNSEAMNLAVEFEGFKATQR